MKASSPRLSKVLTLIGAGIVLATFIVKDVMRERLKDVNDSINQAESQYRIQAYSSLAQNDIAYIKQEIDLAKLDGETDGLAKKEQQLRVDITASEDRLFVLNEHFENLALLSEAIEDEEQYKDQLKKLNKQIADSSAELNVIKNDSQKLFASINEHSDHKTALMLDDLLARSNAWPNRIGGIERSLGELAPKIFNDLATTKQKSKQDYKRSTVAFYCLFALGWVMALVGQLLGVEVRV